MKTIYLILVSLTAFSLQAQSIDRSVISGSGGENLAGGISISWTLGETVVHSALGGSMLINQGFHQPGDFVNAVNSIASKNIRIYPNPSSGLLKVSLADLSGHFALVVRDASGREVYHRDMRADNAMPLELDLNNLAAGYYFLEIRGDNAASSYASKFHIIK